MPPIFLLRSCFPYKNNGDLTFAVRNKFYDICMLFQFIQVIRQVSCGAVHVVALSEEGLLQAWGNLHFLNSPLYTILCLTYPLSNFDEISAHMCMDLCM